MFGRLIFDCKKEKECIICKLGYLCFLDRDDRGVNPIKNEICFLVFYKESLYYYRPYRPEYIKKRSK